MTYKLNIQSNMEVKDKIKKSDYKVGVLKRLKDRKATAEELNEIVYYILNKIK